MLVNMKCTNNNMLITNSKVTRGQVLVGDTGTSDTVTGTCHN